MISTYFVPGGGQERPASEQTIFADGSADGSFRPGLDLELSHWVPNRTPARYKADTSTAICLSFVADPLPGAWDLCVNNHLDVDGVLSLYTLVRGERALAHRDTLVQASRMGDFWDWGDALAATVYQGLALLQQRAEPGRVPLQALYARCFERVDALLATTPGAEAEVQPGLAMLEAACRRLDTGEIARTVLHERFVAYEIPRDLVERSEARALHIPGFNAPLDDASWLPPQARNRHDRERIQLVSSEAAGGWYHDLWYPGYRWAETPDSWAAPGFVFAGSTNGYRFGHAALERAVAHLAVAERGPGRWELAEALTPFASLAGRNYPVIVSCLDADRRPCASGLPPAEVAAILAPAFA
jgi:hypothetical protein